MAMFEIINSLLFGETTTIDDLATYYAARKAVGWTVIAVTGVAPRVPSLKISDDYIARLVAVNDWLRANWHMFADALVDPDADARLIAVDADAYWADSQHPNDAGHAILAELFEPVIQALAD